ncbi:orotidine 5'-phosphate decarboxylase / HUMPS family protein [Pediococcus argentinicus]|uniref:Orotidine 5'-phosphate decarboxylase domain-containing protein n=1 Tax=Pediococcus argentinicus TaxID=480391 RepID=A0A0R2NH25_9LACO|nr:orotidine 5'-phosphate decarboxylase / HUMPS family protein [Pediococcus argentinicus]KRO25097.1 hypothetical protein IV88_GL000430 [Pediococcus argentinicus]NKZ22559.1 3-hexulose-6-phosphate synthase [Pediococcus argentinicus]GEP19603.1 3-hexulose-6-phosphate synthase [Pediococcus argentinicus]
MQLQVAIDRVSLEKAVSLAKQLDGVVPIIEMGTSLVKDYGFDGMVAMRKAINHSKLLIDLKTIDEGQYEFEQGFKAQADLLTVMGASSKATLDTTYETAENASGTMMIDLLEIDDAKIKLISNYPNAVYLLHHSVDRADHIDVEQAVTDFTNQLPQVKHVAVAGGLDLQAVKQLAKQGKTEIVIVGSKIIKSPDIIKSAKEFMEAIQ